MPRLHSPIVCARRILCGDPGVHTSEKVLQSPTFHIPAPPEAVAAQHEVPPPAYEEIVPVYDGRAEKVGAYPMLVDQGGRCVADVDRHSSDAYTQCHGADTYYEDGAADEDERTFPVIHRVPPEIFADVFALVCKESRTKWPLRLSHVCRRWRNIALSLPELWTTIDIDLPSLGVAADLSIFAAPDLSPFGAVDSSSSSYLTHTISSITFIISLHRERSGSRPLDVRVVAPPSDLCDHARRLPRPLARCLAELLVQLAPRWRTCELPVELLPHLGNVSAPLLERLRITGDELPMHGIHAFSNAFSSPIDAFSSPINASRSPSTWPTIYAPRLRAVHVSGPPRVNLPWTQVEELYCVGARTLGDAQRLIALCGPGAGEGSSGDHSASSTAPASSTPPASSTDLTTSSKSDRGALRHLTLDALCPTGQDEWRPRIALPAGLRTLSLRCWADGTRNGRMLRSVMGAFVLPVGLEEVVVGMIQPTKPKSNVSPPPTPAAAHLAHPHIPGRHDPNPHLAQGSMADARAAVAVGAVPARPHAAARRDIGGGAAGGAGGPAWAEEAGGTGVRGGIVVQEWVWKARWAERGRWGVDALEGECEGDAVYEQGLDPWAP